MGKYEQMAASRNYDFATQVDKIVIKTKERMLDVTAQAILDTVEEAQIPVAKGGKMRVMTGFLRSTGIAALNSIPYGPSDERRTDMTYEWDGETVERVVSEMKIGDTFNFGWTANYAKYREAFDGFLESALMNWQSHVDKSVEFFRKRDSGR